MVTADFQDGTRNGSLITENNSVTIDYVVVIRDDFEWHRPSNSPFNWTVSTRGNGTLRSSPSRGVVVLETSERSDYVGITTPYLIDFADEPGWELDVIGRSTAKHNNNTQEFFFLNGADSEENYFIMYDMGGASPNPDTTDDSCGGSRDTPFNRDQLSYRDFERDKQCWDGFIDRPIDWSNRWHGELRANVSGGRLSAFLNGRLQADLNREDGQVMPPTGPYRLWIKNNNKGQRSNLVIHRVQLQRLGHYQQQGQLTGTVSVDSPVEWTNVTVSGRFPAGTSYDIDVAQFEDDEWVYYETVSELDRSTTIRYRVTLQTERESVTPLLSDLQFGYTEPGSSAENNPASAD